MRLISSALCTTVAVALLAGCSGMSQTTPSAPSSVGGTQSNYSHGTPRSALVVPGECRRVSPAPRCTIVKC